MQPSREFKSVGRDQETPENPEEFLSLLADQLLVAEDDGPQVIEITAETVSIDGFLGVETAVIPGSAQTEGIALSQQIPELQMLDLQIQDLQMLESNDKNPITTDLKPQLVLKAPLQGLPQDGENLPPGQHKTTLGLQLPMSSQATTATDTKTDNIEAQKTAIAISVPEHVKAVLQSKHPLAAQTVSTVKATQVAPTGETVDAGLILEEIPESELFPKSELLDLDKTRTSKNMSAAFLVKMAQADVAGVAARLPASVIITSPTAELHLPAAIDAASTTGKLTDVLGQVINPQQGKWDQAVGNRLLWMINKNMNSASIRLDPPSLGKLDIKISISAGEAIINIQTEHAVVRDAIDQAASKLKEMIQNQGFNQVSVAVNQEQQSTQRDAFSASAASSKNQTEDADDSVSVETSSLPEGIDVALNWVNFYA
ncbi:MAG: flagellar hook-length control protein FliK [Gammaproteobacteria bacterium]|nr:flagellar hook-length control protein FliK [Gammaproteobacteria bacterium]